MINISNELRNKIRKDLQIVNKCMPIRIYDAYKADLYFNKEERPLLLEVQEWLKKKDTFFKTSYKTYKINCGRFKGVYPHCVYFYSGLASFFVYDFEKESWEDWFIMEGESYASK